MKSLCLLLTLVGISAAIVIPPENPGEDAVAIVIVQGAYVYPEQYRQFGLALQAASTAPLWVGIAEGFLDNFPNPLQINAKVHKVLDEMSDAGMPADTAVFLAGHSVGGVFVQTEVPAIPAVGLLLFGSYLTSPLAEYPVPVLHLSGTLDGQTRPTRIAKAFSELQRMIETEPDAPLTRPVVLLEAVDHAHFFTGELPDSVEENDILSELDGDEARRMLAQQSIAFMEVARAGPAAEEAASLLREAYNSTGQFLAPLFELQRQEADGDSSDWAQFAQTFLLNIADDSVALEVESTHVADLATLEDQHWSVNVTQDPAQASIHMYSSVESPFNPLDDSANPVTSSEIAVKLTSQENLASLLPSAEFGVNRSCRDINEAALSAALAAAPDTARERFNRRGKPVTYLEDHSAAAGPLWVQEKLRLSYTADGLEVQSIALKTAPTSFIYPGSQYCKLLTPSRALEYILTDGLRGTQP